MSNLIENKSDLTLNVLTEALYKKLFENTNNAINHNPFSDYEFIDTWKQEHESAELSDFTLFLQSNQLYLTVDEETGEVTVAQLIEKDNYSELSANNEINPNILYCVINDPEDSDHVSINSEPQPSCTSYVIASGMFSSLDGNIHSTSAENNSWYRLYSDGWCEQGGLGIIHVDPDDPTGEPGHDFYSAFMLHKPIHATGCVINITGKAGNANGAIIPGPVSYNGYLHADEANTNRRWIRAGIDWSGRGSEQTLAATNVEVYWEAKGFVL